MLVLTRKRTEQVVVEDSGGELIIIEVLEIRKNEGEAGAVRLGIIADKRVKVHRREVYEAIKRDGSAGK